MTENELPSTGRRLGKRRPKNAPALMLSDILKAVPAAPPAVDYFTAVDDYGLYANDTYGDCGPVSVANSLKVITKLGDGLEFSVTQNDVFDLYRRSGNPDFDPNDPGGPGDGGVDMQTMLEALLKGGIGGRKPVAFAKIKSDMPIPQLRAAIAYFGVALLGVNLDQAQQYQTDNGGPWDYEPSSPWGGHAIPAGKYTSDAEVHHADVSVVTWGDIVGCTDAFLNHQLDEAWVIIWPEHLTHPAFLAGIDLQKLSDAYTALTGRVIPSLPPPAPSPTPGAAPFLGADPQVAAKIVRRAALHKETTAEWMNHHFKVVFDL